MLAVVATTLIGRVGTQPQHGAPPSTPPSAGAPRAGGPASISTPSGGPVPAGPAGAGPTAGVLLTCDPSVVALRMATDRTAYAPGDTVHMTSSVVERSSRPCTILSRCAPPDVFGTVQPQPGFHSVEFYESRQTRPCSNGVTAHLLQPGQPVTEEESAPATLPRGGPTCGTVTVQMAAQVYLYGADQLFRAAQATSSFTIGASPCPTQRRGPLG